jgi:hypothetical protein
MKTSKLRKNNKKLIVIKRKDLKLLTICFSDVEAL